MKGGSDNRPGHGGMVARKAQVGFRVRAGEHTLILDHRTSRWVCGQKAEALIVSLSFSTLPLDPWKAAPSLLVYMFIRH